VPNPYKIVAHDVSPAYTRVMQAKPAGFPLLTRFAGMLVVVCISMNMLSAWVGTLIPTQFISLTLFDKTIGTNSLQLMDIRPGMVVKVSDQALACCAIWSPDGTQIAYTGSGSDIFIWDMRADTTRALVLNGMIPSLEDWSADGQWLLFTSRRGDMNRRGDVGYEELYRVDVHSGTLQVLVDSNDPFKRIDFAQWSPDGRFVVFALGTSYITRLWDIYRIEADGQNLQQLSDGKGISYAPQMSPDGQQIAFVLGRIQNNDVFVMGADGSHARRLTTTASSERIPLWSPDGMHILFQASADSHFPRVLDVMNGDGTGRRRLVDDSSFNDPPSWSPDGKQILYAVQGERGSALYVRDADGGNARLLFRSAPQIQIKAAWQPQPNRDLQVR
jgi:Tol biopolymer transport system component